MWGSVSAIVSGNTFKVTCLIALGSNDYLTVVSWSSWLGWNLLILRKLGWSAWELVSTFPDLGSFSPSNSVIGTKFCVFIPFLLEIPRAVSVSQTWLVYPMDPGTHHVTYYWLLITVLMVHWMAIKVTESSGYTETFLLSNVASHSLNHIFENSQSVPLSYGFHTPDAFSLSCRKQFLVHLVCNSSRQPYKNFRMNIMKISPETFVIHVWTVY